MLAVIRNELGSRKYAYLEGKMDKLGEGGARGKLGMKKWQERSFSLNESSLCWFAPAKASKGAPDGDVAEDLRGHIGMLQVTDVMAVDVKGRNFTFQVVGDGLPHPYSFACENYSIRDMWIASLQLLAKVAKSVPV